MTDGVRWDWDRDDVVPEGWGDDDHDFGVLLLLIPGCYWAKLVQLCRGGLSGLSGHTMFLFLVFSGFSFGCSGPAGPHETAILAAMEDL